MARCLDPGVKLNLPPGGSDEGRSNDETAADRSGTVPNGEELRRNTSHDYQGERVL